MKQFASKQGIGSLIAIASLALVSGAHAAAPVITEITDAIDDGKTTAETIGAAGLGILGVFVVFKLVRRAARSLV